jgi:hypothetical protein
VFAAVFGEGFGQVVEASASKSGETVESDRAAGSVPEVSVQDPRT